MRFVRWIIDLGGLSTGLSVLAAVFSTSSALMAVSALSTVSDFVLQMPLYLRVPFLVGAFFFALAVFWLLFGFGLSSLVRLLGRKTADDQTALAQTSHSGPNISTGYIQGDPTINVHGAGAPREQHQSPPEGALALYPPLSDDELSNPHIKNRTVFIADLAWRARELGWTNAVISGRTFEACRIYGPAVVAPLKRRRDDGHTFVDCRWTEDVDTFWTARPADHPSYVGVIGLEDCTFDGCSFTQVGVLVTPEDYRLYRERATNP